MLSLFRKVRNSLVSSNSFGKYLAYAVGETILVVIGILIALSINNWNENRKDRIQEGKVLLEILTTLQKNNGVVNERLYYIDKYQQSSDIIIDFIHDEISYSDTLNDHFLNARFSGIGNLSALFSQAGYTALKSSGFDIIRSDSLKSGIIEMFESTIPLLTETDFLDDYDAQLKDYYLRNFYDDEIPYNPELLKEDKYFIGI